MKKGIKSAEDWYKEGINFYKLNKYKAALDALEEATKLKPDDANAWYCKGLVLGKLNNHKEALKAFERVIELLPDDARAWYNRGVALQKFEKYKGALQSYNKAIELKPDFIEAWINKGVSLDCLNKFKEALETYEKATKIKPGDPLPWLGMGFVLKQLNRYKEALKAFERVIELLPDDARAWYNKGICLQQLGRYGEAIKAYKKAKSLQPQLQDIWISEGELYYNLGLYDQSFLDANEVINGVNANNAKAYALKGKIMMAKADFESALDNFQIAKEKDPDEFLYNLWIVYCKYLIYLKKFKSANEWKISIALVITELERIRSEIEMKKQNKIILDEIYYWLAILYFKIDDIISTKRCLEKCIQIKFSKETRIFKEAKIEMKNIQKKTKQFLGHIYNSHIRPTWWQWWFMSPAPLNRWRKLVLGSILIFFIAMISIVLLTHPFLLNVVKSGYSLKIFNIEISFGFEISWYLYLLFIGICFFFLLSPVISRFKIKEIEFEFEFPPPLPLFPKFTVLEPTLRKLEYLGSQISSSPHSLQNRGVEIAERRSSNPIFTYIPGFGSVVEKLKGIYKGLKER